MARLDRLLEQTPVSGTAPTSNGSSEHGVAAATVEPVVPVPRRPRPVVDANALGLARTRWVSRYVRWVTVGDILVGLAAACVALAVTFRDAPVGPALWPYVALTVAFPFVWVGALAAGRSYEARFLGEGVDEFRRVLDSAVRLIAIVAIALYAFDWSLARRYVVLAIPLAMLGSLAVRALGRRASRCVQADGRACHQVLVTGTERATAEMIRRFRDRQDHPYRVIGALVDNCRNGTIEGVPVVGSSADTFDALAATGADTVAVAAWSTFSQHDLRRLAWELEGTHVDVIVAPNLVDVSGPRISIRRVAGLPLLHVEKPEFTGLRRVGKTLFDRGVAALSLLVLWPLLMGLAIAVRVDSRGPAVFTQERVGKGGRIFKMVKLRSMVDGAEDQLGDLVSDNEYSDGPLFKIPSDPRVTRVGSFLRRTSLDELPQLWNVLRGDMSLVGPRPPLPSEVAQYEDDVRRRLLVQPGLTGLWQVSGRSDLSWEDSVRLDLDYVENWSFLLDLAIIARTFRAVVESRGAY